MKLSQTSVLVCAFMLGLSGQLHAAANQGSGTVEFVGAIIDAPCSIDPESVDQTVEMGQVANTTLVEYGAGTPQNFKIKLVGCAIETAKSVDVTFNGNSYQGQGLDRNMDDMYLQLNSATAKGAGIKIRNASNGETVRLGVPTSFTGLMDGSNELKFNATVERVAEDVEPGEFTAMADFVLAYK
ncbi:fimbrial protein [Aeromonas veronii]|uniref:fimbrial protein n=1 Tax=Aeromonas veronii TaxID=654 RepID=UPI0005C24B0F|nr:fimbrial protein [Aeromonas veronii]